MANRILGVLFKKKYANGDTDTIYPKTRAQDVTTSGGATLETIATKVNGMQEGATKVAKSSTNGNILINGAQTVVYTHPNSGATAGTYNKVTINAQGHVTSGSNVTDWTGTVSGDVSNGTVTSEQSSSRSNLASGEKLSVSMGKIRKWLADLKSLAFVDKVGTSNLDSTLTTFYNNRVTTDKVTQSTSITEAGWVADARVIRTLQNQINTLNSNGQSLQNSIDGINNKISWFNMQTLTLKTYKHVNCTDIAESLHPYGSDISNMTLCRFFPASDGPYFGVEDNFNDGYCIIYTLSDIQYWKIVWFDVRSNKTYIKSKIKGVIGGWIETSLT